MGGWDHLLAPVVVCYILLNLPATLYEIEAYYRRGGQVMFDCMRDDTWNKVLISYSDFWIYFKRYLDRPKSEAGKAYYAYLDWSAAAMDKNIYMYRRRCAKWAREQSRWKIMIYGPFRFNWKDAHNKMWLRGDDAATLRFPLWGEGGEERAREEYSKAKEAGYGKYWHYQKKVLRKIRAEQEAKRVAAAAAAESA
jgi:hypothetical protein